MRISPTLTEKEVEMLNEKAATIRRHIIKSVSQAGSGHPGGSLSSADIITLLYFHVLRLRPEEPDWQKRDRFVLAKGHAAPALYAALAERGFFSSDDLLTLRNMGSKLQGHPDMKLTPGVEASTGSLGQGLSVAVGMAAGAKLQNQDYGVYALLGDGEVQEGQVWEAAMAAAHYDLDNLVAVLDYNRLQIDGPVDEVMSPVPLADKWKAFNWEVLECDGHNISALHEVLQEAQGAEYPAMIIAHTTKGKGVSYMEDEVGWHGKAPDSEMTEKALKELKMTGEAMRNE